MGSSVLPQSFRVIVCRCHQVLGAVLPADKTAAVVHIGVIAVTLAGLVLGLDHAAGPAPSLIMLVEAHVHSSTARNTHAALNASNTANAVRVRAARRKGNVSARVIAASNLPT